MCSGLGRDIALCLITGWCREGVGEGGGRRVSLRMKDGSSVGLMVVVERQEREAGVAAFLCWFLELAASKPGASSRPGMNLRQPN